MIARRNARPAVKVGTQVRFRGVKWQVVALSGQTVHLVGPDGGGETVLAGYLFADPGFSVIGADVPQAAPQWGLFETAPTAAREKALAWQRHVREVEYGLTDGPADSAGAVREQYDPARHTLAEREQAKAEELTALGFGRVSRTTVQRMRLAYRKQGLWGLLDHRTTRASSPTGRADERVVAAVREALRRRRGRSKGTINGLFPLINQILQERHGTGTVPVPSQATLYRLVTSLARTGELPGGPVRQVPASFEGRAFTPATALRPGEQVQIDTTRLDVLALFDDGTLARPELTIAIDVATRAILAAVLCPSATKAVDAALLLAEMAVPHPARPTWPDILRMDHAPALPHPRLATLDERLTDAAARPVVLPETIVVDRGKVFVSRAFTAACETLGISVQPAPPHAPTAKGIVERTFGTINHLFCQHLPGYTGSDVTRRGPDTEKDACYSVAQLQDLLDEWLVHYHHRPHEGLRHPMMPRKALTPNQMWAALVAVAGYVPVPLTTSDYLELLPVRWQAITASGIRIHHRTYDHDLLAPHRGQPSPHTGRGGKWEIHYNPHDVRQVWIRLPDGELTEIPWIHRDHVHQPFNEHTWQHIRTHALHSNHRGDADSHEADFAEALDQLMRRVHSGHATKTEQALMARTGAVPLPTARHPEHDTARPPDIPASRAPWDEDDSVDDLDDLPDEDTDPPAATGYGLYDAHEEADKW
ncbi:Mu transposase C-terminal domain-containing protein [Streptomyces sp. P5_D11]